MFFLRRSNLERLPVAMSGVRIGERALQIGVDDASLVGAIAAKVGLSGHAAVAAATERQSARARAAAAAAGALVDVQTTALDALPFPDESFDVVVLHAGGLAHPLAAAMLRDGCRVLRPGGRVVVIDGPARGVLARIRPRRLPGPAATLEALAAAGFRAARLIAEREGYRFLEAVKGQP